MSPPCNKILFQKDEDVSNQDIVEAIAKAVRQEFESHTHPPVECSLGIDKEIHAEQHRFIDSLMTASDRLEKIKWGFFGNVIKSAGWGMILIIGVGVLYWAKAELAKVGAP